MYLTVFKQNLDVEFVCEILKKKSSLLQMLPKEEEDVQSAPQPFKFTCKKSAKSVLESNLAAKEDTNIMIDLSGDVPKMYLELSNDLNSDILKELLQNAHKDKFFLGQKEIPNLVESLDALKKRESEEEQASQSVSGRIEDDNLSSSSAATTKHEEEVQYVILAEDSGKLDEALAEEDDKQEPPEEEEEEAISSGNTIVRTRGSPSPDY